MKIIFMGTPDFAVPCLEELIASRHSVAAVFSQPDKPVGRKQMLTPPPVKNCAVDNGIPVYQPVTLKDGEAVRIIETIKPDVIIVTAYGKLLPSEILNSAKYGCINVHASLLPKYRGAAPVQRAVINGDNETGVTIMQMDEGLDTGDMLLVEKTPVYPDETSAQLFDRLSRLGAKALLKALEKIENGDCTPIKQPEGDFGYAAKITKDMAVVDWKKSALQIHNQVRGLQTWPCALTYFSGRAIKIHKTVLSDSSGNKPGEVVYNNGVITVSCGDGKCVDILELQPEGKRKMDAKSFLAGNKIEIGAVLGE